MRRGRPPLAEAAAGWLCQDPLFRQSSLAASLRQQPLGFVDVGSLGGVHPLVDPIAPLVDVLCFDPNEQACRALRERYDREGPFHRVMVEPTALGAKNSGRETLYIANVPTNTSLLQPDAGFLRRYRAERFKVRRTSHVPVRMLDSIAYRRRDSGPRMGEFLKLDTQGSEYEILRGARKILEARCLGVWCEVEFFEVYAGQKTYADIDRFLRDYGLLIYALYPHYRSAGRLDRKTCETEERLMWANALFLKDPLDPRNARRRFSRRDIEVLIVIGLLTKFYDFALELVHRFVRDRRERALIGTLIERVAGINERTLEEDVTVLGRRCRRRKESVRLLISQFVAEHHTNGSVDDLIARHGSESRRRIDRCVY